jgi:hypothetical protein
VGDFKVGAQTMSLRLIASILLFNAVPAAVAAEQPEALLQAGLYDITYSLELPHLESWAIDKTATLCLRDAGHSAPVLPVLSDNTPFADCVAKHIVFDGAKLSYDIVCAGRDSAKAHANYIVASGAFRGRVAMVMGAKNMTMTETQVGRRRGSCDLAGVPKADR